MSDRGATDARGWRMLLVRDPHPARTRHAWHALQRLDVGRHWQGDYAPNEPGELPAFLNHIGARFPGPWVVYAKFKAEPWVHLVPSSPELASPGRVAEPGTLHVLAAWFDPAEGVTHVRLHKRGRVAVDFSAAGTGAAPLRSPAFTSSEHRRHFLKGAATVADAVGRIFASLDATPRPLAAQRTGGAWTFGREDGGELDPDGLEKTGVRFYAALTSEENPASARLAAAINADDVQGVRQALADGASVEFLPESSGSPLGAASINPRKANWRRTCRLLVAAGAPLEGYEWEDPMICRAVSPFGSESGTRTLVKGLLRLGADVNARSRVDHPGGTALHLAVFHRQRGVAKLLIERGARLDVRDDEGRTPLEYAEWLARGPIPASEERARMAELLRTAAAAAAGEAPVTGSRATRPARADTRRPRGR